LLHLFISRQVWPDGAFLDDLPCRISEVIARAEPFNLANETRDPLRVRRRPARDMIENFFDLIFCHGHILAHRTTFGASRDEPGAR
jgi:hypothetical protein